MKDKYLQVFNYLKDLTKIRSNVVRDISDRSGAYPEVIWFEDLPLHPSIQCITQSAQEHDEEWISVTKPEHPGDAPQFPKIPELCQKWVIHESLTDEEELPKLNEQIEENGETLLLENFPKVEEAFSDYLDQKWFNDLEKYEEEKLIYDQKLEEYKKLNSNYNNFFTIHNKAKRFSEEYELVVGLGLLAFKEGTDAPKIYRHLAIAHADIELDIHPKKTTIRVTPSVQDFQLLLETDFIVDLERQFDVDNVIAAEKKSSETLKKYEVQYTPFDAKVKDAFLAFASHTRPDVKFIDAFPRPQKLANNPEIHYSPALILRRRNVHGLYKAYEYIVQQLEEEDNENIEIPNVGGLVDKNYQERPGAFPPLEDPRIYFPKKYNDEQVAIVEKSRRHRKVLVQGPPGTGKSHTIANLICHLLAQGNKILVTAATTRALQVLKSQLPEEFRSLTVNLLGGDSASLNDLKSSVQGINKQLENINSHELEKQVESAEKQLDDLKRERSSKEDELLSLQERNFRTLPINDVYQGSLNQLAERVAQDKENYQWFTDSVEDVNKVYDIKQLELFYKQHADYSEKDISEFELDLPYIENLPTEEQVKDFKCLSEELEKKRASDFNLPHVEKGIDLQQIISLVQNIQDIRENIQSELPYCAKLYNDFYEGNKESWDQRIQSVQHILNKFDIGTLKWYDDNVEITFPADRSLLQLKSDARVLWKHLQKGNKLSGIGFKMKKPFLPVHIKERLYFVDEVLVNGSPCDTPEEFSYVLEIIHFDQGLEDLEGLWKESAPPEYQKYHQKFQWYIQELEKVHRATEVFGQMQEIANKIAVQASIKLDTFEVGYLTEWIEYLKYLTLQNDFQVLEAVSQQAVNYLEQEKFHPIAKEVIHALQNKDIALYEQCLLQIQELKYAQEDYKNYKTLDARLAETFPQLIEGIKAKQITEDHISEVTGAIYWKHAEGELKRLLSKDAEPILRDKMAMLENKIDKTVGNLAALKAWHKVHDRLESKTSLRRHLKAFALAASQPKSGKRALKNRLEAQHQLEYCKDAVPCWVMPLYKVAETMKPQAEMFDYVIVDEASQLGPDAIFLFYLAKKIIIVGDDKQTSPEYVGVNTGTVKALIHKYLQGIDFSNYYSLEYSFFDHADMLCDGSVTLREHFRCMPEIIEFCNRNFYEPEGKVLYPLKQYSEKRLPPLETVYCHDGYTEGSARNLLNLPEAEKIVAQIKTCIQDKRYRNKTMGVIGLQGNVQAAKIEALLINELKPEEFAKRKIVCGNSASFQGDERDIMFLSLVTTRNHNRRALVSPADERRFNVAVSRAKEQAWLFHSVQLDDLINHEDLRYRLLDHFLNYKPTQIPVNELINCNSEHPPEPFDSWFEVDVYNDLVRKGYPVIPQYKEAKGRYRIDLVIILGNGIKLAIECDGDKWHGPDRFRHDMERQKILERCGWQFFRIRASAYYFNREKATTPLWEWIADNEKTLVEKPIESNYEESNNQKESREATSPYISQTNSKQLPLWRSG